MACTLLPGRPSLAVQDSHSLYPTHRARPAPAKPTHTEPSRSASTQQVGFVGSPCGIAMRSQTPLRRRSSPDSVGTIRRPCGSRCNETELAVAELTVVVRLSTNREEPERRTRTWFGLRIQRLPSGS